MAGYTLGFDGGGAVDDQDDTPTIPPIEDASADAGQGQSPEAQGAPANTSGFVPGGAPGLGQTINSGVKRIASYLMGADAAPPQVAQKFEQGIKSENPGISDDDANLLAVHKAAELGGPAAAWQMVQYNRTAYNAKTAFAKAALNGIDGKAGNVQAAAQAATQAGAHILDGSATVFTADPGGSGNINAQVKVPGTTRSLNFQLNPQQFNQWLDVGGHGQWDRVMEDGTPQALQKLAGSQDTPAQPATGAQPTPAGKGAGKAAAPEDPADTAIKAANDDNQDSDPQAAEANPNAGKPTNIGHTPSSINLGEETQPSTLPPKPYNYGNDLEAQSRARFPNISDEDKRQAFMAEQQNQRSERIGKLGQAGLGARAKENVARATGQARVDATTVGSENRARGQVDAAEARAGGQRDAATINAKARTEGYAQRAAQAALAQASRNNNAQASEANKNFRAMIAAKGLTMSDDDVDQAAAKYGVQLPGRAAPTGKAAAAPTGQGAAAPATPQARPANVPQGAKFFQGKWYTRGANGEAVPVE
jgi:hypothetical protein